jgi:hypothetical protein
VPPNQDTLLIASLDLAAILYPKNYVLSVLGQHPKQTAKFVAAVYTMSGKASARTLDIGPKFGESRIDVLNRLLWKVEVEVGKMMAKDSQSSGK